MNKQFIKKKLRIAVLLDTFGPYQARFVEGIESILRPLDICSIVIHGREFQPESEHYKAANELFDFARADEIDGVIAACANLSHNSEVDALEKFIHSFSPKPIISAGLEISGISSVCVDNQSGMQALTKHLVEVHGHKRFAFVRGFEKNADSILRENVFRNTLTEYNIELDPDLTFKGNFIISDAFTRMDELLSRRSDFDVVVAANDHMAYGIIQALTKHGLRVPYDIAVTGFDDYEDSVCTVPPLTTVRQPIFELGAEAAKAVLAQIKGESVNDVQYVPTELVVRNSCGVMALKVDSGLEPSYLKFDKSYLIKQFEELHFFDQGLKEILEVFIDFTENDNYLLKLWMAELDDKLTDKATTQKFFEFLNYIDSLILRKISNVILLKIASDNVLELHKVLHTLNHRALTQGYVEELTGIHDYRRHHLTMSMSTSYQEWRKTLIEILQESSKRAFVVLYNTEDGVLSNIAKLAVAHSSSFNSSSSNGIPSNGSSSNVTGLQLELPIEFERTKMLPSELFSEFTGKYYLIPLYTGLEQFGFLLIDSDNPKMLEYEAFAHGLSIAIRNSAQIERLRQHTKELENANNDLAKLAQYDALTGLANRTLLTQRLEHACLLARDKNQQVALFFLDLDGFKYVNDSLGHDSGDKLLQNVAKRLRNIVKREDTVARLGGDEFTIVMSSTKEHAIQADAIKNHVTQNHVIQSKAIQMAERILGVFEEPFKVKGSTFRLTASIGIAMFPTDGQDPTVLMKHADVAMYKAKNEGKNRFHFYNSILTEEAIEEQRLVEKLQTALCEGEIWVAYQPRFDIEGTTIRSLEALARWQEKDGTFISPAKFIAVAEKYGLIHELGMQILRQACSQVKIWAEMDNLITPSISVNLSANQLQEDDIVEQVALVLVEVGLEPTLLELEITESAAMIDVEQNIQKLHRLRDMGVKISIDDFGTAYSSLNYLKRLPVTTLKIDQSFVMDIEDLHDVTSNTAVIRAVIALGKSMCFNLVAEGV